MMYKRALQADRIATLSNPISLFSQQKETRFTMSNIQGKPIPLTVTTSGESLIRTTIPEGPPGAHELLKGYGKIQIEAEKKDQE